MDRRLTIGYPEKQDTAGLIALWQASFGDPVQYIELFLKNRVRQRDCLVCKQDGVVAAALYLLPCSAMLQGALHKAGYIYAAATLPAYRGRGLMGRLLEAAAVKAKEEGLAWIALKPSDAGLFDFYGKHGYKTMFSVFTASCRREEISAPPMDVVESVLPGSSQVFAIRREFFGGQDGVIHWDEEAVRHVLLEHNYTGGQICAVHRDGQQGYLLWHENAQAVIVKEMIAPPPLMQGLLGCLLSRTRADQIIIRLPAPGTGIPFAGRTEAFGMACPVCMPLTGDSATAYLGMAMD